MTPSGSFWDAATGRGMTGLRSWSRRPWSRTVLPARPGPRRLRPAVVLVPLLAAVLGSASTVIGQEPPPSERTFFEPVDVSVVDLEVLVTDSAGRAVTGLTSADFEVFEDGERVEITHFYAAPGVVSAGLNATPPITPEEEADQDLYLAIVVVDSNLGQANRKRSLNAVSEFLPRLPRNTYVMLARCTGQLQILQPFTNDQGQLRSVLERMRTMASAVVTRSSDRSA